VNRGSEREDQRVAVSRLGVRLGKEPLGLEQAEVRRDDRERHMVAESAVADDLDLHSTSRPARAMRG
jgi:hypothetical protein